MFTPSIANAKMNALKHSSMPQTAFGRSQWALYVRARSSGLIPRTILPCVSMPATVLFMPYIVAPSYLPKCKLTQKYYARHSKPLPQLVKEYEPQLKMLPAPQLSNNGISNILTDASVSFSRACARFLLRYIP